MNYYIMYFNLFKLTLSELLASRIFYFEILNCNNINIGFFFVFMGFLGRKQNPTNGQNFRMQKIQDSESNFSENFFLTLEGSTGVPRHPIQSLRYAPD